MWHEARRSEKKVHDLMDAARKRAQRRAVFLANRRGDPHQSVQLVGARCRLYRDDAVYQATHDQQGLIPWNGKQDILIDRFDGRALLDFIREPGSRAQDKTEEEDELEEFVNFERYRDLIKHRRRGCRFECYKKGFVPTVGDEEGLQHVDQELEAKYAASFASDRSQVTQPPATKGPYSQVGFSYDGDSKEENQFSDADDNDDDEDDNDFNSDDSNDEGMDKIAKEFGVKRYGWLVYKDKRANEEERRQKEVIKGDPSVRKLSRKERRKVSQIGREREREAARCTGNLSLHNDPYRETRRSPTYEAYPRSKRSRSRSPSYSRRHSHGRHSEVVHRSASTPKIEYITEFGGSSDAKQAKGEGFSPPSSPPSSQADPLSRLSSGQILEALHVDPASGVSLGNDKGPKVMKPFISTSSALAKLNKASSCGGQSKQQEVERKETPQERLKRIMNKQLNKQIKKDSAAETAKKREQERQRLEKLAETNRRSSYSYTRSRSRSRSTSPSPPRRRHRRSRSPPRSYRRYDSRSPSSSRVRSRSRY